MIVRAEQPQDQPGVRLVNLAAFESAAEADLVDALRQQARPLVSLVAQEGEEIVGHVLFSPVSLGEHAELSLMGLAPMAVMPAQQRKGVGSALVRAGVKSCRALGTGAVVVLGHASPRPAPPRRLATMTRVAAAPA